jgi:flavin-dependent dehydrogenase
MDGPRATGIQGRAPGGPLESYTADLVVGADGRFSLVARTVGARDLEVADTLPVTYLYAYWCNVAPYDAAGDAVVHGYAVGNGVGYLLMDSADDTTAVVLGGRSALFTTTHMGSEALYLRLLHQQPRLWRRFGQAEQVTTVRGMRDVGNVYRTASGPGWALVGDAVHQVDPLDGQGIFDAVFSAKALSHAIVAWRRGEATWAAAGACYAAAVRTETEPMFKVTLNRVKTEVYGSYPDWAYRTVLRWISTDPAYLQRIGRLLVRDIDPAHARTPRVILGALARGAGRDLTWRLMGHPRHDALPPLAAVTASQPPRHSAQP